MADGLILIVEDDPGAVEAFEPMLRANGYAVRAAPDAEAGLRAIAQERPVAVLLDLHLPAMDGVEFLRRLRAGLPHLPVPVALVTGDYLIDEAVVSEIEALGARLCFKPLWEEDLVRLLAGLVPSAAGI